MEQTATTSMPASTFRMWAATTTWRINRSYFNLNKFLDFYLIDSMTVMMNDIKCIIYLNQWGQNSSKSGFAPATW